jgi:preprotein translocase, SecE subunit, bacterial
MAKENNNAPKKSAVTQARKVANNKKEKKKKGSTREYWKGVKQEMSKVIWPTKKELGAFTVVVICTCAAFALAFWGIDSGFLAILKAVLGITLS